jgi:hypothetical protein
MTTNGTGATTLRAKGAPARNKRSVWSLATAPCPEAHFATFPPKLVEPCILAGTSARGVCPSCAAPWERITGRDRQPEAYPDRKYDRSDPRFATKRNLGQRYQDECAAHPVETFGWRPTCKCGPSHADPIPATVLDPFLGAGTTGLVAARLGRDWVGIELSPAYAEIAHRRLGLAPPLQKAA